MVGRDPDTVAGKLVAPEDQRIREKIDRLEAEVAVTRANPDYH
jgi:hypothetical protein